MSELPPNIDAILASIRSRMTEDRPADTAEIAAETDPEAAPPLAPAPATPDIGQVQIGGPPTTVEALIRSLLEPMLKTWLDANMPEIVERLAQAEIKRLTGRL